MTFLHKLRSLVGDVRSYCKSLLRFILAATLVSLQLAGSNPVLHDFLHGPEVETHGCCPHEGSESEPVESDHSDCDESCAVGLLADGIWVSAALELTDVPRSGFNGICLYAPEKIIFRAQLTESARAPPVS